MCGQLWLGRTWHCPAPKDHSALQVTLLHSCRSYHSIPFCITHLSFAVILSYSLSWAPPHGPLNRDAPLIRYHPRHQDITHLSPSHIILTITNLYQLSFLRFPKFTTSSPSLQFCSHYLSRALPSTGSICPQLSFPIYFPLFHLRIILYKHKNCLYQVLYKTSNGLLSP